MDQGQLALNSYQQYLAQANAIQQAQQSQQAGQGAGAAAGYAAKGGAIPARGYASGGSTDPDVATAAAQSNGQPKLPTTTPAIPPAAPPQSAIPAPNPGTAAGAPSPAAPQSAVPAGMLPSAAPPPVPAGGMPHAHPAGLTPLANPKAPITTVPPQALQASSPAEAALRHGQLAFGLHPGQNPQANPQQTSANYTELQHGAGAESNQTVQEARVKMFGPGAGDTGPNATPLGLQNASLLNNLYNYDLENHGPAVAAADSFAVLQNYRINMQMYGGAAAASFESGNLPAAAHYLQQAYAFFPDGNDVSVKPGPNGSLVATRTDPNGKVIDTSTFATPDDLYKFIMQSSSFETYNAYVAEAQKAQLDAAVAGSEIGKNNAEAGAASENAASRAAEVQDEATYQQGTLRDDDARTAYETNPNKPKLQPTASEAAAYGGAVVNMFNDPTQGVGDSTGFNTAPAQVKTRFVQLVTGIGLANSVDPATAASWAAYVVRNPGAYDPKTNTFTIAGKQYSAGTGGTLLSAQSKATGGAVSPAARAMADLPSS
jgi:hypothetical protein